MTKNFLQFGLNFRTNSGCKTTYYHLIEEEGVPIFVFSREILRKPTFNVSKLYKVKERMNFCYLICWFGKGV